MAEVKAEKALEIKVEKVPEAKGEPGQKHYVVFEMGGLPEIVEVMAVDGDEAKVKARSLSLRHSLAKITYIGPGDPFRKRT